MKIFEYPQKAVIGGKMEANGPDRWEKTFTMRAEAGDMEIVEDLRAFTRSSTKAAAIWTAIKSHRRLVNEADFQRDRADEAVRDLAAALQALRDVESAKAELDTAIANARETVDG